MAQLRQALAQAVDLLTAAQVPSAWADAQELAAFALGISRGELSRQIVLGAQAPEGFSDLVAQRAARVPLQHLTGRAYFRTLELSVGPGVFVPRPETEVVAGVGIADLRDPAGGQPEHPLVVELCAGSAAMSLAVATEVPTARVIALELSPDAVAWAQRNVDSLGLGERVELRCADVVGSDRGALRDVAGQVDLVLANPPYIPSDAVPVDPEVRDHDPAMALYGGGDDGLLIPAATIAAAAGLLCPGGLFVMEHADTQGAATRALARAGWTQVGTIQDLSGRDRALAARRSPPE